MNLIDKLFQGMQVQWKGKKEAEKQKQGNYRGGNSGIIIDGLPAGKCPRKALARNLGYWSDVDWDTQLMFDVGELNEERWELYLSLADVDVRKSDHLVQWETEEGTPVSGSPDAIIYEEGKPVHGIEHKHASSMNTAVAAVSGEPKLDHLIQTAHYSFVLGLPFSLVYTSSTVIEGAEWKMKQKKIPKPGELRSELCSYTYYKFTGDTRTYKTGKNAGKTIQIKKKIDISPSDSDLLPSEIMKKYGADFGDLKSIRPFAVQYPTRWVGGTFEYYDGQDWVTTIVTEQGIRDYYSCIDKMKRERKLAPRPLNLTAIGDSMSWSVCNYCEFKERCDASEHDYDSWIADLVQ